MGCFCRKSVQALQEDARTAQADTDTQEKTQSQERAQDQVVTAVGAWLAARWLPAPKWEPDPEWLQLDLPEPPMPPAAFTVVTGLVQAQQACQTDLAIDPTQPDQLAKLARIVTTLNRRLDDMQQLVDDETPWDQVAALNDQADTVRAAAAQGLFQDGEDPEQPVGPWRPLLAKVKALAPLVSVFRTLDVDPTDDEATNVLADRVRQLRAVTLPPVAQPLTLYRLIARFSAVERLQRSLGADPRTVPFSKVERAVQRKVDAVTEQLPTRVQLVNGQVVGMPPRQPNPSQLLTPVTIEQVQAIQPDLLDRMHWQVPQYDQLDLLTTAAPVSKLVGLLTALGANPVRSSPCDRSCDAGAARSQAATGSRGSGTGAAPAR